MIVTAAVGVLCARVRVEEKQIIAALAEAGVPAMPLPPACLPLSLDPTSSPNSSSEETLPARGFRVLIDRCQDRAVAAAVIPVLRAQGILVLDAGIAATVNRLAVASTVAAAGLPRPATRLACSTEAALAALDEIGYPATLFPLLQGSPSTLLIDRDTAEAVLEHRAILGSGQDAIALIQAGGPAVDERVVVDVVGGRAIGGELPERSATVTPEVAALAEAAAMAVGATVAGVEIAITAGGPVVWDIQPTPEFRRAMALDGQSVAVALARFALDDVGADWLASIHLVPSEGGQERRDALIGEASDSVALFA